MYRSQLINALSKLSCTSAEDKTAIFSEYYNQFNSKPARKIDITIEERTQRYNLRNINAQSQKRKKFHFLSSIYEGSVQLHNLNLIFTLWLTDFASGCYPTA